MIIAGETFYLRYGELFLVPDAFQVYTALVVGASAILMFSLAIVSYLRSRILGEDVLRSRMFLKSHLLRRGYLILIFASVGLLFLTVPLTLGAEMPWTYVLAAAIFVMGSLDLAILYFYSLVARWESPFAAIVGRLSKILGGILEDDTRADDR